MSRDYSDLSPARLLATLAAVFAAAVVVWLIAPQLWWFAERSRVPLLVLFLGAVVAAALLVSGCLGGWNRGQRLPLVAIGAVIGVVVLMVLWLLTPSDTVP